MSGLRCGLKLAYRAADSATVRHPARNEQAPLRHAQSFAGPLPVIPLEMSGLRCGAAFAALHFAVIESSRSK